MKRSVSDSAGAPSSGIGVIIDLEVRRLSMLHATAWMQFSGRLVLVYEAG